VLLQPFALHLIPGQRCRDCQGDERTDGYESKGHKSADDGSRADRAGSERDGPDGEIGRGSRTEWAGDGREAAQERVLIADMAVVVCVAVLMNVVVMMLVVVAAAPGTV